MRKTALLKVLRGLARETESTIEESEGGNHTIVKIAGKKIPIPRHREIDERLAKQIIRDAEKATDK